MKRRTTREELTKGNGDAEARMDGFADEMRQVVVDMQLCLQELLDRARGPPGADSDQGPTYQP